MSGIYIKNVEMPNNCFECPFAAASYYAVHNYNKRLEWGCILTRKTLTSTKRNRACPLISVPYHGRLIDADALKETVVFDKRFSAVYETATCRYLDKAQTIIPAEEDEE